MPYINKWKREEFETSFSPIILAGELNYIITKICDDYMKNRRFSYDVINEVIGVLECAKLELYRRIAAPYEDQKMVENGDVYTVGVEKQ